MEDNNNKIIIMKIHNVKKQDQLYAKKTIQVANKTKIMNVITKIV